MSTGNVAKLIKSLEILEILLMALKKIELTTHSPNGPEATSICLQSKQLKVGQSSLDNKPSNDSC